MTYEIVAYKTTDSMLFEDHRKAEDHQLDLIGEALDNLIMDDERGNVTRIDRFSFLKATMLHKDFKKKVTTLYNAIQ